MSSSPTHARSTGAARDRPAWRLSPRQRCDFELLATGAFSPLTSFLGQADYESVCATMRLADGSLWPVPVTLDISEEALEAAARAGTLSLRDKSGSELADLRITEAWRADHTLEARTVFGTTDAAHPAVLHLCESTHPWYVSGELTVRRVPTHPDLPPLVLTPAEVRAEITRRGWDRVVAFNTRNPMHAAHREIVMRAAHSEDAGLLIHPVVGVTRPGDVSSPVRARCYQAVMRTLPSDSTMLALLPLAMRMAGPREALWHAIIRRNYGATAMIVGRDHAGPGPDSLGRPFYDPYAAQRLVGGHQDELGIRMVAVRNVVHVDGLGYVHDDKVPAGMVARPISGTRIRRHLAEGTDIPAWLALPEVVAELRRGEAPTVEDASVAV